MGIASSVYREEFEAAAARCDDQDHKRVRCKRGVPHTPAVVAAVTRLNKGDTRRAFAREERGALNDLIQCAYQLGRVGGGASSQVTSPLHQLLRQSAHLSRQEAAALALFFDHHRGCIDPRALGKLVLHAREDDNRQRFIDEIARRIDMRGMPIHAALYHLVYWLPFRFPEEPGLQDNVLSGLGTAWHEQNGHALRPGYTRNNAVILAFCTHMLSSDMYDPTEPPRLSLQDFLNCVPGTNINREELQGIYDLVAKQPLDFSISPNTHPRCVCPNCRKEYQVTISRRILLLTSLWRVPSRQEHGTDLPDIPLVRSFAAQSHYDTNIIRSVMSYE